MKHVVLFVLIILLLLAAAVGCGTQSATPASEESTTTVFEEPTSSHAELQSEIERLKWKIEYGGRSEPHPIDAAYDKAMKEAVETSFTGYREVISEYAEIWKEEMEKYLDLLVDVLDEEHRKLLDTSQKKWEMFIDDNFKLEYDVVGRASGHGTMMGDIARSNQYNKYRDRTLFLEMLYINAQEPSYQSWPWNYEE